MKALKLYGGLGLILLALLVYADFRAGGCVEGAFDDLWRHAAAGKRSEYARPLPPLPATRPTTRPTDE